MSTRDKILDDIARVAGNTVGVLNNVKGHASETVRTCVDTMAQDMDLVPRDEFERLESVIEGLTLKQEQLVSQVAELEKKISKNNL